MFRWFFQGDNVARSFDSPSETQSARDDRKTIGDYADNFLLFDLVIGEVEMAVVRYELDKEMKEEEERKAERRPDYSWLMSGGSRRFRKQLDAGERNRIENACERLKPCEWSKTIETWKMKTKNLAMTSSNYSLLPLTTPFNPGSTSQQLQKFSRISQQENLGIQ